MKLKISTKVQQDFLKVKDGFNEQLFLRLNPPFPFVRLLRFDGCEKGDLVSIELDFVLFKQMWESQIIEDSLDDSKFHFIDVGDKLPFFLSKWKHTHIIKRIEGGSEIIDDIDFYAYNLLFTWVLYPILYLQFLYRKPIYRKVFG